MRKKKFQLQYRRDDSDPSYWQHVTVKPDGQVVHTARFRVGEDFECTFIGGRNYKCRIEVAGGKIVESRTDVKNPAVKYNITHEIVGGELVITGTVGSVVGVTRLRRIE